MKGPLRLTRWARSNRQEGIQVNVDKTGPAAARGASMLVMAGWRGLLDADGYDLRPGARPEAISEAERVVSLRFPAELRSLYLASDGVFDTGGQWWVIWPLAMLAAENTARRQAGVLPAGLIAFGDDGTGNPFCMRPGYEDVGCWHPIDGRYQPLAANLAAFWQGWAGQTITT